MNFQKNANWRLTLNVILVLGPYRDEPRGISLADIVAQVRLDNPAAEPRSIGTCISHMGLYLKAPISKVQEGRFVRYYVALGDRMKAKRLLKNPRPKCFRPPQKRKPAPITEGGKPVPVYGGHVTPALEEKAAALSVPETAPLPEPGVLPVELFPKSLPPTPATANMVQGCYHLIVAKNGASLTAGDVADFYKISDGAALDILVAACRHNQDTVGASIHARLKTPK